MTWNSPAITSRMVRWQVASRNMYGNIIFTQHMLTVQISKRLQTLHPRKYSSNSWDCESTLKLPIKAFGALPFSYTLWMFCRILKVLWDLGQLSINYVNNSNYNNLGLTRMKSALDYLASQMKSKGTASWYLTSWLCSNVWVGIFSCT
jgi:hypothetical protein